MPRGVAVLLGAFSSFVFDYMLRNALTQPSIPQGTSQQIPVPPPDSFAEPFPRDATTFGFEWIAVRVLQLVYTSNSMAEVARDLGVDGSPFLWDPEQRAILGAELDAAFFHLFGVSSEDVLYTLDIFTIVRRKEVSEFGEYRSRRLILDMCDAMASSG